MSATSSGSSLTKLNRLLIYSASEAMFEYNYIKTTCLEGTAQTNLNKIRSWGNDPNGAPVLWLSGPMGTGKSCIAQTLAKEWAKTRAVATFNFSEPYYRRIGETFIVSCAYQLFRPKSPLYDAAVEEILSSIIEDQPSIIQASMSKQFETLIGNFLPQEQSKPAIIMVDSLDECSDSEVRVDFLNFIASYVKSTPRLNVRFFVSSRPVRQIRQCMEGLMTASCLEKVNLQRTPETDSDIAKYLKHEFYRIPLFHYYDRIISELVNLSAGLFIFASTVARYVGITGNNPAANLAGVLAACTSNTTQSGPYETLDALYLHILENSGTKAELLTCFLQGSTSLMQTYINSTPLNERDIETFTQQPCITYFSKEQRPESYNDSKIQIEEYVEKSCSSLKPLLIVKKNPEDIRILHASFGEFLKDKNRSKQFYVAV